MNADYPLIASPRPLFGQSLIDKKTDLELLERFSQPQAIEQWFEEMAQRGVRSIILPLDERFLSILRRRKDLGIEVIPLIPNVMGLVREATEYGMLGAGFRLVRRMGFGMMIWLGIRSMPKAPAVLLRRDFPTILSILFDLEMSLFRSLKPKRVLLNPQIADLLLGMGNGKFFQDYGKLLRSRFGVEPGIATGNFATMIGRLCEWNADLKLFLAPLNAEGWAMKPSAGAYDQYLSDPNLHIIADRITTSPPASTEDIAKALAHPAVKELAVDVVDWVSFGHSS